MGWHIGWISNEKGWIKQLFRRFKPPCSCQAPGSSGDILRLELGWAWHFPSAMVVSLEVGRPQPGPMFEATTLNGLRLRTKPEDFETWRESLPDLQEPLVDVGTSIWLNLTQWLLLSESIVLPQEDLNIPIRLRVTTSRNSCAQIRWGCGFIEPMTCRAYGWRRGTCVCQAAGGEGVAEL